MKFRTLLLLLTISLLACPNNNIAKGQRTSLFSAERLNSLIMSSNLKYRDKKNILSVNTTFLWWYKKQTEKWKCHIKFPVQKPSATGSAASICATFSSTLVKRSRTLSRLTSAISVEVEQVQAPHRFSCQPALSRPTVECRRVEASTFPEARR